MRLNYNLAALAALAVPSVSAWGSLGHITVGYVASDLVQPQTAAYFQNLLRNNTDHYLAGVATWADSIRYTKWGRFSKNFHFIDAHDSPPHSCNVDFQRDCKEDSGCVVSAVQNYTEQLFDRDLWAWRRNQAAKFVVHFVGDIHQPLHAEDVALGGNRIHVRWHGRDLNLHHVWDSSIAEDILGGIHRKPYQAAWNWSGKLFDEIRVGRYRDEAQGWAEGMDIDDPIGTTMRWAEESNALICSHVLPEGPDAIVGQELAGGEYYEKAAPVIELQVAKAGYRLAKWLDLIAERILDGPSSSSSSSSLAEDDTPAHHAIISDEEL